jgi:hypothetical protein
MYWPHIWWLNQAVERGVDCNERWLYAELIIHCVDCSVAESEFLHGMLTAKHELLHGIAAAICILQWHADCINMEYNVASWGQIWIVALYADRHTNMRTALHSFTFINQIQPKQKKLLTFPVHRFYCDWTVNNLTHTANLFALITANSQSMTKQIFFEALAILQRILNIVIILEEVMVKKILYRQAINKF